MIHWFRSSLRNKLAVITGTAVYIIAAAGMFGVITLNGDLREYERSSAELAATQEAVLNAVVAFKTQVQEWKNVLLRGSDAEKLDKYWKGFVAREAETARHLKEAISVSSDPAIQHAIKSAHEAHAGTANEYRIGLDAFRKSNFDAEAADKVVAGIDRKPTDLMLAASAVAAKQNQQRLQERVRIANRTFIVSLILTGLTALLIVPILIWLIKRAILGPVQHAVEVATGISKGNLSNSVRADRMDEIGTLLAALSAMQQNLSSLVGTVRESAVAVSTAAEQVATGTHDLSRRTEEQAVSLEQTAASMQELTASIKGNTGNAKQANDVAGGVSINAENGGATVGNVVTTMNDISAGSKQIGEIVSVIDGIAFQTNILALNAAVEAARAGEQGRGFAVVASEVRALAQRSATAAREVKQLIGVSVEKVELGARQVGEAGEIITKLVHEVKRVSGLMNDIAIANNEQSLGVEQINVTVLQMDGAVQQNATLVEQSVAAAESMRTHAGQLLDAAGRFKLGKDQDTSRSGWGDTDVTQPSRTPWQSAAAAPRVSAHDVPKLAGGFGRRTV